MRDCVSGDGMRNAVTTSSSEEREGGKRERKREKEIERIVKKNIISQPT
jgi:hypothetical protein